MVGSGEVAKLPGIFLREFITAATQKAICEDAWSMRKKILLVHERLALEIQFHSSTDAELD